MSRKTFQSAKVTTLEISKHYCWGLKDHC